ncbi:MAG: translation initiation factor IF-2 [Ruminococcaceae bacterium]|nr:translation initiation factor IF-2 [Oscillospiraceae bacterium]
MAETVKISQLAKDLEIKSKDLVALFTELGMTKQTGGTLEKDEVSFVIQSLMDRYPVDDINEYIDGKYKVKPTAAELAELEAAAKAEAERLAAEKAEAERIAAEKAEAERIAREKAEAERLAAEKAEAERVAAEKKAEEEKKALEAKRAAERMAATERAAANAKAEAERKKKEKEERFAAARPGKAEKKEKKREERGEKRAPSAQQTPVFDGPKTEFVAKKKETRIIDTKIVDIDLSKYDEKNYEFGTDAQRRRMQPRRPRRNDKKKRGNEPVARATIPTQISIPESIVVSDLAKELRVTTAEVMKKLMMMGAMATANQSIDFDTAALVADEFGSEAIPLKVVTIEEKLIDEHTDGAEDLEERSPVVVVMGHVDHGKTSILDAIRHANVTAGEAGGITQHIGAYRIEVEGKPITFLDTPGHAAFTAMRARGAQLTDIAILVVAADDGIMPQTVEAINHAKAAGVSIIVAINKMDKPGANPDSIKQELTKYDLVPEEWGGDVICVPVSALTKKGIPDLLENILLIAEMADLKANPNREAKGAVIEAKLDKGRGPVATVLVQNGTLHVGDVIIAGGAVGRVRAMTDDKGRQLKVAGPSVPVEILGLDQVPGAGDIFNAVKDEKMARELADQRKDKQKEEEFRANAKVSLEDFFNQMKEGVKSLNIIVKADVQGSAEAVKASLEKLSCEEVKVKVIHAAVGGITENDVMLAAASQAIIVGFNVRPDRGATESAVQNEVDIRTYRIIYECLEEIEKAMKGMLAPTFRENVLGQAEVRQTIRVPGVGVIAGSYVIDGKVTRNSMIRVLRDSVVIFEDKISSLKRFKDDAKEVAQGYECGIGLEKFNDIHVGDVLEAYIMEEVQNG